jgi:hypothetical protein
MVETGKLPNFLTVDFHEVGDVFATKDILNANYVGLNLNLSNIDFSLYPNPVVKSNPLTLDIKTPNLVDEVRIIDLLGSQLRYFSIKTEAQEIKIQTPMLENGFYFLQLLRKKRVLLTHKFEVVN